MNIQTDLSTEARELAETTPRCWEYHLFVQVLIDEVSHSQLLKSLPPVGQRAAPLLTQTEAWLKSRLLALNALTIELGGLLTANHDDAFGQPGFPGNATAIVAFARRLGRLYNQMIEWGQSLRFAELDPKCQPVAYEMSFMADEILRSLEEYGPTIKQQVDQALKRPVHTPITIEAILSPRLCNEERVYAALASLSETGNTGGGPVSYSSNSAAGYIYVLQNDSIPNLLKIGRTSRSPRERIAELSSSTGVPTPFSLAFQAYVDDCASAEYQVHAKLTQAGCRVASNREFFNVDLNTAIATVIEVQKKIARERPTSS